MKEVGRRDFLIFMGATVPAIALPGVAIGMANYFQPQVNIGLFLQLSSMLMAQPQSDLNPTLAAEYVKRLQPEGDLDGLLNAFNAATNKTTFVEDIFGSPTCTNPNPASPQQTYRPLAKDIILIWYTSTIYSCDGFQFGSTGAYVGALIWNTIDAHPPAQCGGPLGYWSVPSGETESWSIPAQCGNLSPSPPPMNIAQSAPTVWIPSCNPDG